MRDLIERLERAAANERGYSEAFMKATFFRGFHTGRSEAFIEAAALLRALNTTNGDEGAGAAGKGVGR